MDSTGSDSTLVVRDPLGLANTISIDAEFGPVLDLLDGTRTVAQVTQSLRMRGGPLVEREALATFVADLSLDGWLDDERFRELWSDMLDAFLAARVRAPLGAGLVYPADPSSLRPWLHRFIPSPVDRIVPASDVRAIVLPHSPADMSGQVLSATMVELPRAEDLDLIVLLATAHAPGRLPLVSTTKPYQTPLGVAQPHTLVASALHRRAPSLLREEVRHRQGLGIELTLLALQHVYETTMPPVLTLLCGSSVAQRPDDAELSEGLAALEAVLDGQRVLWCGAAELSHAGPAFGHPPLDADAIRAIEAHDHGCLRALGRGRLDRVIRACLDGSTVAGPPSGTAVLAVLSELARTEVADSRFEHYVRQSLPAPSVGSVGLAGVRIHRRARL